jgi:hypothetical protein
LRFEVEKKLAVLHPSEKQVINSIARLRSFGPSSFASLSDDVGNYVQVAGGGITCMLERRDVATGNHYRGFKETTNPNYPDGTRLVFGAGEIMMQSDEWFLQGEIAEVFAAFLNKQSFPSFVKWRHKSLE